MSRVIILGSFVLVVAVSAPWRQAHRHWALFGTVEPRRESLIDRVGRDLNAKLPFDSMMPDRVLMGSLALSALMVLVLPALAVGPVLTFALVSARRRRAREQARSDAIAKGLPETIDLLMIAIGSGLTLHDALVIGGPWFPEPFAVTAAEVTYRCRSGETLVDALETSAEHLGAGVRPLISLLVASESDGSTLLPALERAGDESRRNRRVAAEDKARRIPVAMLFPLVTCILPAFALLTVVPLLLATLGSLEIPG